MKVVELIVMLSPLQARTSLYLEICAAACQAGTDVLRAGGSAVEAASRATVVLEDAGETNAGFGSNLTESGTVEMDAGLMEGASLLFGAVGAISGVKNPILVAEKLVEEQGKGLLPLGRVPPGFLVGAGARDWAVRHNIQTVKTENLISEKAAKLYRHYKKKLDAYRASVTELQVAKRKRDASLDVGHLGDINTYKRLKQCADYDASDTVRSNDGATKLLDGNSSLTSGDGSVEVGPSQEVAARLEAAAGADAGRDGDEEDGVGDTVGVVVLDRLGRVASTVSSGGIALKQPGRVGQASCFGCGCWAQRPVAAGGGATAVSTTGGCPAVLSSISRSGPGCGEHLVRTFLARECGQALAGAEHPLQELQRVMKERFAESEFLAGVPEKLGGAICMQVGPTQR